MIKIFSDDDIYSKPLSQITDFIFDENVARVFPDMIKRSIPGYAAVIHLTGILTQKLAQKDSYYYDLGCSLGGATLAIRRNLREGDGRILAIDNAVAMLSRCRKFIKQDKSRAPVDLICADIRDIRFKNAAIVVLNYTLQFIPPADRLTLLTQICRGMKADGALILSEKIRFSDPRQQQWFSELYYDFKRYNGYSELEISQKRSALEKKMITDTIDMHKERLRQAGFKNCHIIFQCINFITIVAEK